jgi:hypothetical protein
VRNFSGLPEWWHSMASVIRISDSTGQEEWLQDMNTGPLVIAVVEERPPFHLTTEIITEENAPFGGRWIYALDPEGGGTRVTVTEDGFIDSLFFRFIANAFIGLHATADSYLRALGARFGESVEPEHL